MTSRSSLPYLGHMLDYARRARAKARMTTRAQFETDEDAQIVVTHLLQRIGEAARRVSEETRREHPEIPWEQIIGMRHRIVHDYFDINLDVVWDVAQNDLPSLIAALESFVPSNPPE